MDQVACIVCMNRRVRISQNVLRDYEYGAKPTRQLVCFYCMNCRSEFIYPRPSEWEITTFYPEDYHAYHDDHGLVAKALVALRSKKRAKYYSKIAGRRKGKMFDVGAGDCRHFDALRSHCDFEFYGVELKSEIAAKARARGYQVVDGTLETMDLTGHEGQYDIVSMNHLIEHVIDPRLLVQRTFTLLRPGGTVIGQLPSNDCWERRIFDSRWAGYHYPRHLQAFSRQGLRMMLEEAGFVEVQIRSAPHLQTALSLQNLLISKGWRPRLKYGKSPIYSLFLIGVVPFEVAAFIFGQTGIINFEARKPPYSST